MEKTNKPEVIREWRDVGGRFCQIIRYNGKDTKYVTNKNGYISSYDVTIRTPYDSIINGGVRTQRQ